MPVRLALARAQVQIIAVVGEEPHPSAWSICRQKIIRDAVALIEIAAKFANLVSVKLTPLDESCRDAFDRLPHIRSVEPPPKITFDYKELLCKPDFLRKS